MSSAEYFIIAGMILVGIIFFFIAQTFIFKESEEVKRLGIKAESEEIASLIYRISKDPAPYLKYCQLINLANITIEKSMLRYERGGYKFLNILPPNVSDTKLIEVAQFCIVKRDSRIEVLGEAPICEINGICMFDECKEDCPDCYGPVNICIGDGTCNAKIGENCENSPVDCSCSKFGSNYACCPQDPQANEHGCVNESRQNLNKGEECFCDNECRAGLKCNPTAPSFTAYKKACCPEEKRWNGSECIVTEAFDIFIVPVQISDQNQYFSVALSFKNHFLSVSPFKECSNRDNLVKFWIINISDCPSEAASSCSDHCSDCINIGRRCARRMESILGVNYDKFVVLTNGGGWLGGCACDIPCDGSSSSLIFCSSSICVPSHEIGHDLGLGHVDCGVDCHACLYYPFFGGTAPNCPDCGHPERAKFIMDYCRPMERYGPAGYDFLKNRFIGTSPHAAGLGKWMKECLP